MCLLRSLCHLPSRNLRLHDGSLNGACNPLTGQCECRDGVTGRDCSRCQHRHAFIGGVCTSCDQGCYLPLMTMVDELEITLANQNFSTLRPIPWKRLSRIGNNTGLISEFMRGLDESGEGEVGGIARDSKYAKEAFAVVEGARFQAERMAKSVASLDQFTTLAENLILDAQLTYANAFNTTQFLKHFHEHGGTTVGGATLDAWVREAEAHYNATLDRGEYIEKRLNRAEQEHKYRISRSIEFCSKNTTVYICRKNEELLKRVFANKLNDTSFENIQDRLDEFDQWLEDYRATIYDSSRKDTAEAEQMSNVVAKRIDRYKSVARDADKRAEMARKSTDVLVKEVRKARIELEKNREALEKVGGISAENRNRADEMQKQLALLKDKINEAREKAQQVRFLVTESINYRLMTFHGVIGSLVVDGTTVPLWAFSSNSPECDGATSPPQPTVRGYMFRGSETSGDFIVLYLKDGHVVFKIHLGGESHAEITSKHNYADGREHTVKAIRSGNEIHLQVDSDADRFSTTIPGENTVLNIEADSHYVAGVPASLKTGLFNEDIEWKGFFGCILSVKPSQTSDLDLDNPVRWLRREPGCHFSAAKLIPTDRIVGFSRPGFLLQQGVIMDNNSSFAFGFRTKEENGTLIFQSSKLSAFRRKQRDSEGTASGKGYMAFYLFRGYLVLHFGKDASSRREVVTIRSNHMYNDGQLHSVFMSRKGKIVRLRVDDKEVGEKQTLDDESPIGTATSQMFIGGFAERSKPPNNEIPTTVPLIGCVSDMYHNYKKIPIVPEEHSAEIGTCAIESPNFASPIGPNMLVKVDELLPASINDCPTPKVMRRRMYIGDGLQKSIKDGSRNIDISLSFRPIVDEGTVLALLTNSNPDAARLTIEVKQNKERNELPVDLMSSDARDLFLNLPVNVAGVSAPVAEKLSMTSLMGCYRELRFAGHPKYFENALKQNKVAVDGCPFH
ncbi:laminin G domain protein [Teladorsagia circumcincta]|uniref:Laminin G domain protein n=1 Tax=Teladorsagia circumcincta TaxID=45464 RepID=A0A2G9UPW5_TELCI|nr:laminin G domain protein [Teladorsagia circumcincta]